jgi:hypothetical protein
MSFNQWTNIMQISCSKLPDSMSDNHVFSNNYKIELLKLNSLIPHFNIVLTNTSIDYSENYIYIPLKSHATFQDIFDFILTLPFINNYQTEFIKFKLACIFDKVISSRTFMNIPINEIPKSQGHFIYKKMNECESCFTRSINVKHCATCRSVYYCNKICQRNDWSTHKFNCSHVIESEDVD